MPPLGPIRPPDAVTVLVTKDDPFVLHATFSGERVLALVDKEHGSYAPAYLRAMASLQQEEGLARTMLDHLIVAQRVHTLCGRQAKAPELGSMRSLLPGMRQVIPGTRETRYFRVVAPEFRDEELQAAVEAVLQGTASRTKCRLRLGGEASEVRLADRLDALQSPTHASSPVLHHAGATSPARSLVGSNRAARLLRAAGRLGSGPSPAVIETETRLGSRFIAVGGLLLLWLDSDVTGLGPETVRVHPAWEPSAFGFPGATDWALRPLPEEYLSVLASLRSLPDLTRIDRSTSRPKVWLREYVPPLTDRPGLELTVGRTDYYASRALQFAHERQVPFRGTVQTLREAFERRDLDILYDLPGMVVTHSVIITADDHLVVAQRGRKGAVDFDPGAYSPSCEEQWDPAREQAPHDTVLRCLREEWSIAPECAIPVTARHVRLVALGREWGSFWNTALVYLVRVPCTGDQVLDAWDSVPQDRAEAAAVGVLPLASKGSRAALETVVRSRSVSPQTLAASVGARWRGLPSDHQLHAMTGVVRVLIAMSAVGLLDGET